MKYTGNFEDDYRRGEEFATGLLQRIECTANSDNELEPDDGPSDVEVGIDESPYALNDGPGIVSATGEGSGEGPVVRARGRPKKPSSVTSSSRCSCKSCPGALGVHSYRKTDHAFQDYMEGRRKMALDEMEAKKLKRKICT